MVRAGLVAVVALSAPANAQQTPSAEVEILRDDWGVAHVYAQSENGAYYGWGYAMAEDRLESVLRHYLWGIGSIEKLLRSGLEQPAFWLTGDPVQSEIELRRWRPLEAARTGVGRLSPQLRRNYEQFIAGLQAYMDEHPDQVPEWAPALEPALPIAYFRSWQLAVWGEQGSQECRAALAALREATAAAQDDVSMDEPSSNAWVLMPWRTAEDSLIHLTDPHTPFDGLGEMYEIRLHGGDMHAAGISLIGLPWIVFGHTDHVALGATNGQADAADCYEVKVDPAKPTRYRFDDDWRTVDSREVVLSVSAEDGSEIRHVYESTRHNGLESPVVGRHENRAFVASTPYVDRAGLQDEQLYRQMRARSVEELIEAQRMTEMLPINFMAGDVAGNALYVRTGRIPVRPSGYDWSRPVPGNTSETEWRGVHPFEELIWLQNPSQGYMQNNNVAPDRMMEGSPLTSDRYPSYLFNLEPGFSNTRGDRAVELLSKTLYATAEDAIEIALDETWPGTEPWLRALATALAEHPQKVTSRGPAFRRFTDRLLHFDGVSRKESTAALQYSAWRQALASLPGLEPPDVSALADTVDANQSLSAEQQRALIEAVDAAMADLQQRWGRTDLRFGDVLRIGREGQDWPVGGGRIYAGDREIRSLRSNHAFLGSGAGGRLFADTGQVHTLVTILSRPVRSFSGVPFGVSGRPNSPHFSDQARLASERRLKPTYFNRSELEGHIISRRNLLIAN
jgi:acyl-homoserine lactone acylase PvdQ